MGAVLQSQHILTIFVNVLIQNDILFIADFRLTIHDVLGALNMFCILVYYLSYPMPWPLRPLPFKSGLARSWVRLALGSRRPLRVGSCLFASGQTGNVFYGLQGTLVYPSYPVYPSYVIIWEMETLGKWKVSKGAKSGKEKSQETGTVRERGKSGKRQRQETGKVRKSLRIRCRHRNLCVYSAL